MDPGVLFSGLRFDKRFGTDLKRFKKVQGNQPAHLNGNVSAVESERSESFQNDVRLPVSDVYDNVGDLGGRSKIKKRKKASSSSSGQDTSFSVFKTSTLAKSKSPTSELLQEDVRAEHSGGRKPRKDEESARLRNKYRLHVAGLSVPQPLVSFEQLRSQYQCKKFLMRNISQAGFIDPTPIQRQAIPTLLERRECLACAPTGSGKTLAFALPIVMNLKNSAPSLGIRAVILCPVRELATQTARVFKSIVPSKKLRVRVLTTALFKNADFKTLPCDVLISTPLRLELLLKEMKIDLSKVEYLVMDESDKLFEMGFVKQIDSIVAACSNPGIARSLFSATLPDTVEELARTIMHDAIRVVVGQKNSAASTVEQKLLYVGSEDGKLLGLRQLFKQSLRPPVLLFVDSKDRAKMLHRELAFENIKVNSIHADKSQEQRDLAVEEFREGKAWVLIATDIMARGMDFKGVNCVINYDFPHSTATYIHRIGRSGRAGRSGESVTLYTDKDVPYLRPVANLMRASGCQVPEWMLSLPKVKSKNWKR